MAWFKVDDNLAMHPKVLFAGNAAMGLWVRSGSWCAAHLTNGRLPEAMVQPLGGRRRDADRLVEAGLWVRVDGGYEFKDWEKYQPTKSQVDAEREATRERVARWRKKRRNGEGNAVTNTVGHGVSTPAPTRPDPTPNTSTTYSGADAPRTAQTLVAEWIDNCAERPPGRVIGQVSRELKALLDEGQAYDQVRQALAVWHRKSLNPAALASVLHELRNPRKLGNVRPIRPGQPERRLRSDYTDEEYNALPVEERARISERTTRGHLS